MTKLWAAGHPQGANDIGMFYGPVPDREEVIQSMDDGDLLVLCTGNTTTVVGVMEQGKMLYKTPVLPKTKAQRQAESYAAEQDRPRREAERARDEAKEHAAEYTDVTEALERIGVDPDRLRRWLNGPFEHY